MSAPASRPDAAPDPATATEPGAGASTAPDLAQLPVVVIGAGPVGLAAAANLVVRGLPVLVLEAGDRVGAAVRSWGHVRTFTPWQYVVDERAEALLTARGWSRPATAVPPTGDELVEQYLEPLAAALGDRVLLGRRVVAITRDGMDRTRTLGRDARPFLLRVQEGSGGTPGGEIRTGSGRACGGRLIELRARAVIDASGTWPRPNPLGASGLPARGEDLAGEVLVGPLPDVLGRDRDRFAGRRTLVVGAGHSAANTLLALGRLAGSEPGTQIVWAIRRAGPEKVYGGGEDDELAARGRLGADLRDLVASGAVQLLTRTAVTELVPDPPGGPAAVSVIGTRAGEPWRLDGVHNVAAATGFRPDLAMLSELQLDLDPALEAPRALAPLIDPQFHSCGTVPPHGHRDLAHPEPGFYLAGMKSYGRAPTFLITTGNEQVRSIAAALAGDLAAADEVRLVLPGTGVCSSGPAGGGGRCAG